MNIFYFESETTTETFGATYSEVLSPLSFFRFLNNAHRYILSLCNFVNFEREGKREGERERGRVRREREGEREGERKGEEREGRGERGREEG